MNEELRNFTDGEEMGRRIAREAEARGVSPESLIEEAIQNHTGATMREILEKAFPPTVKEVPPSPATTSI